MFSALPVVLFYGAGVVTARVSPIATYPRSTPVRQLCIH